MKKNILIIGTVTGPKMRGVGRYVHGLIRYLSQNPELTIYVLTHPETDAIFKEIAGITCIRIPISYRWSIISRPLLYVYYKLFLSTIIHKHSIDVVHLPNILLIPKVFGVHFVATLHDVAEFRIHKYSFLRTLWRKFLINRVLRTADKVITVSQTSTKEIAAFFAADVEPIYPHWLWDDTSKNEIPQRVTPTSFETDSYVIYLGSDLPHKNVDFLCDLWARNPALPTLKIGGDISGKTQRRMHNISNIDFMGYVSETEKHHAIANADAAIFASSYEGFGIPLVEAIMHQKPIVCSDIPIFREVLNNQGHFFKVNSPDEFQRALQSALKTKSCSYSMSHLKSRSIEEIYEG